jgi:GNAT superfamily N-acetyltransferase
MKSEFRAGIILSEMELCEIRDIVMRSHISQIFYKSIDGLTASSNIKFCGVYVGELLACFAWVLPRVWTTRGRTLNGLSIGIVTTREEFRRQGLASKLILSIEQYAWETGVDFMYLQGIKNFYVPLGFRGFAPKSKYIFDITSLPEFDGFSKPATESDISVMDFLYNSYHHLNAGLTRRSHQDWRDLIGPLSSTFLFYGPTILMNNSGDAVGYYCTSPDDPTVIREFVVMPSPADATVALAALARDLKSRHLQKIEIFASETGPVRTLAAQQIGADFLTFFRPQSSNMIKWLRHTRCAADFDRAFIFQGDNL